SVASDSPLCPWLRPAPLSPAGAGESLAHRRGMRYIAALPCAGLLIGCAAGLVVDRVPFTAGSLSLVTGGVLAWCAWRIANERVPFRLDNGRHRRYRRRHDCATTDGRVARWTPRPAARSTPASLALPRSRCSGQRACARAPWHDACRDGEERSARRGDGARVA